MGAESVNFKPEQYKTQSNPYIMQAVQGNAPSAAASQMKSGLGQALANAASMGSGRAGVNPALAAYQGQQATGRLSAEMIPQMAAARAQEMESARAQALQFDQMMQQAAAQRNQLMMQKALAEYQQGPMWQQLLGQGLQAGGAIGMKFATGGIGG